MKIFVWTKTLPVLIVRNSEFDFVDNFLLVKEPETKRVYYVPLSEIQAFYIEAEDGD